MKKINIGVIGAGRIGRIHAANLLASPGFNVKYISDPFIDESWVNSLSVTPLKSHEVMFEDSDIDAICICSPTSTHADLIVGASGAGKHVLCEKPISLDLDKTRNCLQQVKESGIKLQIGFNRRFDPNFLKVKEIVAEGKIGKVHQVRVTSRDPGPPPVSYIKESGGLFLDMTIHDFDIVRFLCGAEVTEVYAIGANLLGPEIGEAGDIDTAIITLKLDNGAMGVIDNSRGAAYGYDQRVEVFGSEGSISAENELPNQTVLLTKGGVIKEKPLHFFLERYEKAYRREIESFYQYLSAAVSSPASGEDGLKALLIGLAAKESLKTNRPVSL